MIDIYAPPGEDDTLLTDEDLDLSNTSTLGLAEIRGLDIPSPALTPLNIPTPARPIEQPSLINQPPGPEDKPIGAAPSTDDGHTYTTGTASEFGQIDINNPNDSHVGAWDNDITSPTVEGVALPSEVLRTRFGDPKKAQGALVYVEHENGRSGVFPVVDIGPHPDVVKEKGDMIDLTAGAAAKIGHSHGLDKVRYRFLEPASGSEQGPPGENDRLVDGAPPPPPSGPGSQPDQSLLNQPPGADDKIADSPTEQGQFKMVSAIKQDAPYMSKPRDVGQVNEIVVHGTERTNIKSMIDYTSRYDSERGFAPGYHFLIDYDGTVHQTAPVDRVTNHVKGKNSNTIGVSILGADDGRMPTAAQEASAKKLLGQLGSAYHIDPKNVHGHGEIQGDRDVREGGNIARETREYGYGGRNELSDKPPGPDDKLVGPESAPPPPLEPTSEVPLGEQRPRSTDYAPGIGPIPTAGSAAEYRPGVGPGVRGEGVVYDTTGPRQLPSGGENIPTPTNRWVREKDLQRVEPSADTLPRVNTQMADQLKLQRWVDLDSGMEVRRAKYNAPGKGISRAEYEESKRVVPGGHPLTGQRVPTEALDIASDDGTTPLPAPFVPPSSLIPIPGTPFYKTREDAPEILGPRTTQFAHDESGKIAIDSNGKPLTVDDLDERTTPPFYTTGEYKFPVSTWDSIKAGVKERLNKEYAIELPQRFVKSGGNYIIESAAGAREYELHSGEELKRLSNNPYYNLSDPMGMAKADIPRIEKDLDQLRIRRTQGEKVQPETIYKYGVGYEKTKPAEDFDTQEYELNRRLGHAKEAAGGGITLETAALHATDWMKDKIADQMILEGKRSLPEIATRIKQWETTWAPYINQKLNSDGGVKFAEGMGETGGQILTTMVNPGVGVWLMFGKNYRDNYHDIEQRAKEAGKPMTPEGIHEQAQDLAIDQTALDGVGIFIPTKMFKTAVKSLPANFLKLAEKEQGKIWSEVVLPTIAEAGEEAVVNPTQDYLEQKKGEELGLRKPLTREEAELQYAASSATGAAQAILLGTAAGGIETAGKILRPSDTRTKETGTQREKDQAFIDEINARTAKIDAEKVVKTEVEKPSGTAETKPVAQKAAEVEATKKEVTTPPSPETKPATYQEGQKVVNIDGKEGTVTKAQTDPKAWVTVDFGTGKPLSMPPDMIKTPATQPVETAPTEEEAPAKPTAPVTQGPLYDATAQARAETKPGEQPKYPKVTDEHRKSADDFAQSVQPGAVIEHADDGTKWEVQQGSKKNPNYKIAEQLDDDGNGTGNFIRLTDKETGASHQEGRQLTLHGKVVTPAITPATAPSGVATPTTPPPIPTQTEAEQEAAAEKAHEEKIKSKLEKYANLKLAKAPAIVNVPLKTNDGTDISVEDAAKAIEEKGVKVTTRAVKHSGTEPTFVATLSRPLTPEEAHDIAVKVGRDDISQKVGDKGEHHGPGAEYLPAFDEGSFLKPGGEPVIPAKQKAAPEDAAQIAKVAKEAGVDNDRDTLDKLHKAYPQLSREISQAYRSGRGKSTKAAVTGKPSTKAEQRAEVSEDTKNFRRMLRKLAPGVAKKVDALVKTRAEAKERINKVEREILGKEIGDIPEQAQAAIHGDTVYLFKEAQDAYKKAGNQRTETVRRLMHELAHRHFDSLAPRVQSALSKLWKAETENKVGPLYDENGDQKDGVMEGIEDDVNEWYAERAAMENDKWAQKKAKLTEHNGTALGRAIADLRGWLHDIYTTLAGKIKTKGRDVVSDQFRQFLKTDIPTKEEISEKQEAGKETVKVSQLDAETGEISQAEVEPSMDDLKQLKVQEKIYEQLIKCIQS